MKPENDLNDHKVSAFHGLSRSVMLNKVKHLTAEEARFFASLRMTKYETMKD
jgi:hypothetical protein